jgi:hypothetical protein
MMMGTREKALKSMLGDYKKGRVAKLLPEHQRPMLTIMIGGDAPTEHDDAEEDDEDEGEE